MSDLVIRPAEETRYDAVSLGEVMLRLDPGEGRIRTTRSFRVWEGGGEYNVARGLRRAFGLRTAIVTALADNEVGRLVEDCILTGGLDTSFVKWVPYDGVGRAVRSPNARRRPRDTLYSPPPSHARNERAVRIRPSPGSRRSMTSPRETAS